MLASTAPSRVLGRNIQLGVLSLLLLCSLVFVLKLMLSPDPARSLYYKAQGLEAKGLWEQALRHYELVVMKPDSEYAPRALRQQGDILAGLARRSGDQEQFRQAVTIYLQLADRYQDNPLAGEALFAAGNIATNDLRDTKMAKRAYETLRERYPNNTEYSSEATLRLGRVALMDRDGKQAQSLLQKVIQAFANYPERCADAQYHLGVAYETLFKKQQWAENAYKATIERYPQTVWARNAEERLGRLFYDDYQHRPDERRVLIEVPPLPDEGGGNSLLSALRPLLSAYGLQVNSTILQGWSLEPFYAGFKPGNPPSPVRAEMDEFHNIVAAAGLRYANKQSKDARMALQNLQDELDAGHPALIYNGRWRLVTGYDSMRDQVFLQNRGATFEVVPVKEFSPVWQRQSSQGAFAILSFRAPNSQPKAKILPASGTIPQLTPQATPNATVPSPQASPIVPSLVATPTWSFALPSLSARSAHIRAIRSATALMSRSREGQTLLNLEALDELSRELNQLATPPAAADGADAPEPEVDPMELPARRDNDPAAVSQPTPTQAPRRSTTNTLVRVRSLMGWFQTPMQAWLNARRDAAAYLDTAAGALNQSTLSRAADHFRTSISELEQAAAALPNNSRLSDDGKTLSGSARASLRAASRHIAAARDAEKKAVAAMNQIG